MGESNTEILLSEGYDPFTEKLALEINWDMKDDLYKKDGKYYRIIISTK